MTFYRSQSWNDPDHKGYVVDLAGILFSDDEKAFAELFERQDVQDWLLENGHRDIVDLWKGACDPLVSALAHGMSEVRSAQDIGDLDVYAT